MNYDAVMTRESDGKISSLALRIPSTQTAADFLEYTGDVNNPSTIDDAVMIWRMYRYARTPAPPRVIVMLQGVPVSQEVRRVYSPLPIADKRDRAVEFARQYDVAMGQAAAPTNLTESAADRLARCMVRCKLLDVANKALNDDIGRNAGIPTGGRVVFREVPREDYQTLRNQHDAVVRERDQLGGDTERSGARIAQLRTRLQDSERRMTVAEQQLSDERHTVQGLRTDVERLNTEVATLTSDLQGANKRNADLGSRIDELDTINADLKQRIAELENPVDKNVDDRNTVTPRKRSLGER